MNAQVEAQVRVGLDMELELSSSPKFKHLYQSLHL